MADLDIKRLLEGNDWLSSAVLLRQPVGQASKRLRLSLRAAGHRLILTQGIEEFLRQIRQYCGYPLVGGAMPEIEFVTPPLNRVAPLVGGEDVPAIRSWIEEAGKHRLLLEVSDALSCFHGHFPGFPILAGVVQLHWAARLAACLFGFGPAVTEVRQLKFRRAVIPPCWLELSLVHTRESEVRFEWSSRDEVHAQGNMIFGLSAAC